MLKVKDAWENVLKVTLEFQGNGHQWDALFTSINRLKPVLEKAIEEEKAADDKKLKKVENG